LGRQLTGDERVELAARLPLEAAQTLTGQIPDIQPLTGFDFVKDLADRTGATVATTRWDTGSVLCAVAALAGPDLLTRILRQLPSGYALLFGRAELTPAAWAGPAPPAPGAGVAPIVDRSPGLHPRPGRPCGTPRPRRGR